MVEKGRCDLTDVIAGTKEPGITNWVKRQPEGVRQFLKFAVVGGSSTVLDMATYYVLWHFLRFIPYAMADWVLALGWFSLERQALATSMTSVISSGVVGTANAFYWNRRWTFRAEGRDRAGRQLGKFFVVAYTGMALRAGIGYVLVHAFVPSGHELSGREAAIWQIPAILMVMFWNFFVNRLWTFKKREERQ